MEKIGIIELSTRLSCDRLECYRVLSYYGIRLECGLLNWSDLERLILAEGITVRSSTYLSKSVSISLNQLHYIERAGWVSCLLRRGNGSKMWDIEKSQTCISSYMLHLDKLPDYDTSRYRLCLHCFRIFALSEFKNLRLSVCNRCRSQLQGGAVNHHPLYFNQLFGGCVGNPKLGGSNEVKESQVSVGKVDGR